MTASRLALALLLLPLAAPAATLPDGFAESQIATGLDPTAMVIAPDGRVFVAEKAGRIRVVKDGVALATPFAVLDDVNNYNEAGLDGICLHPDFAHNHWIYAFYCAKTPATHDRVVRFTAAGDVAAGPPTAIFELETFGNIHNGGAMVFREDGRLYLSTGETGDSSLAQALDSLQGKVLRLNDDGTIPADNPFAAQTNGIYHAIWAIGLRNPFTAAVQPQTDRYFVNDVGQSSWEEVDQATAGCNFGWPLTEGYHQDATMVQPTYSYPHSDGCAITGGTFYDPPTAHFPAAYVGRYFFADYCSGWVRSVDPDAADPKATVQTFATGINRPIGLAVAPDGTMYYLARAGLGGGSEQDNTSTANGTLWRIRYTASAAPTIAAQPQPITVPVGGTATFLAAASGAAPLAYQWTRGGADIAGATTAEFDLADAQLADSGAVFAVRVTNAYGAAASDGAQLSVTTAQPPVTVIDTPAAGAIYRAGDVITYSGHADDPQDGTIPPSGLTWVIDFHHDTHFHPVLPATSGVTAGTLTIPTTYETSANVWYRIALTATDSAGLTTTTIRDLRPHTADMGFRTDPPGLQIALDGARLSTPATVTGVTGIVRQIAAPAQTVGGVTYVFQGWSDGGAQDHQIATPEDATTWTARYQPAPIGIGTGLSASYWANQQQQGTPVLTRLDGTVDFTWGAGAPDPSVPADHFSARWTGFVQAQVTQTYQFHVVCDDGARLTVNGQQLVDAWYDQNPTDHGGAIDLVAGHSYAVTLDYFEDTGGATARLEWSGPATPLQVVPATQLYPVQPPAGGWTSAGIGGVGLAGSAAESGGTWTVLGSGGDIWNRADAFRFVAQSLTGDGEIVARVVSQTDTDPWAKAGVMIREAATPGSRHALMGVTPHHGTAFQRRVDPGGASRHTAGTSTAAPRWVRLTRVGDVFSGYESADGVAWMLVGAATIAMGADTSIGLVVTAHDDAAVSIAVFDSVTVTAEPSDGG